jgi:hypothetical protein
MSDDEKEDELDLETDDQKKDGKSADESDKKRKINHFNEGIKKWKEAKANAPDQSKDGKKRKKVEQRKEKLDADYGACWRDEITEDLWYPELSSEGGIWRATGA